MAKRRDTDFAERAGDQTTPAGHRTPPAELGQVEEKAELSRSEIVELARKAEAGDKEAFEKLRANRELTLECFEDLGLTSCLRKIIVQSVCSPTTLYTNYTRIKESDLIAKAVAGPTPTPLEKLLADQVSITWLSLRMREAVLEGATDVSFKQAEWMLRSVESATRRFESAVRTLAQVRRLQLPALLQVNVATQQVVTGISQAAADGQP